MRFSTTNSASLIHDTPSSFKKVFSTIVKKLPHNQQKVAPVMVKNDKNTVIKVVAKSSAISKEDDVYRNLRNYYTNNTKKQLVLDDEQQKKNTERETRHKTVKQYQQTEKSYHWKEHSKVNITAPLRFQTHDYIRDTRSNSNFLRIQAMSNNASSKIIMNKEKQYTKKRKDDFVWGNPSSLRNVVTYN